jgi:hypothetical protein
MTIKLNTASGLVQKAESLASLLAEYNRAGNVYEARADSPYCLVLWHKGNNYKVGEIISDWGHIMDGHTIIVLTQQPYANNYGTDGGIRYYASGEDTAGNHYLVAWDTCREWDEAGDTYKASGYDDMPSILDDESNACAWETPAEIKPL